MDNTPSNPGKEPSCILFVAALLVICTAVVTVTVQAVGYLVHALMSGRIAEHWLIYLAVGVGVAAVIAGVRRVTHSHQARVAAGDHAHPSVAH